MQEQIPRDFPMPLISPVIEERGARPRLPPDVEAKATPRGIVLDYTPAARRRKELERKAEAIRSRASVTAAELRDLLLLVLEELRELREALQGGTY